MEEFKKTVKSDLIEGTVIRYIINNEKFGKYGKVIISPEAKFFYDFLKGNFFVDLQRHMNLFQISKSFMLVPIINLLFKFNIYGINYFKIFNKINKEDFKFINCNIFVSKIEESKETVKSDLIEGTVIDHIVNNEYFGNHDEVIMSPEAKFFYDFLEGNFFVDLQRHMEMFQISKSVILVPIINLLFKFNIYDIDYFKIFDKINKEDLKFINCNNFLLLLLKNNKNEEALKLLKLNIQCNLRRVDNNGSTALLLACINNMKEVVLQMLKFDSRECNLKQVDNNGHTALLTACKNKMTDVVLKMSDYGSEECNLKQIDEGG